MTNRQDKQALGQQAHFIMTAGPRAGVRGRDLTPLAPSPSTKRGSGGEVKDSAAAPGRGALAPCTPRHERRSQRIFQADGDRRNGEAKLKTDVVALKVNMGAQLADLDSAHEVMAKGLDPRVMPKVQEFPCAFCKATGILPKTKYLCPICGGRGLFLVAAPAKACICRRSREKVVSRSGPTCPVCGGIGVVTVRKAAEAPTAEVSARS